MRFKGKYWIIAGFAFMLGIMLYGIMGTYNPEATPALNFLSVIDWIAASIIYFFFGAAIGHLIDGKKRNPLWFYITTAFFLLSIIIIAIVSDKSKISLIGILIFPLAYGIFFTSQAFSMILPTASIYAKALYNLLLTALFIAWLRSTMNRKERIARILLMVLFLIFLTGFIGCTVALA